MTAGAAARRYARALFDVLLAQQADLDRAGQELTDLAALFASHDTLANAMSNPAVPAAAKRKVMDDIASRAGLSQPVTRLLGLLADRDRLGLVPDIARAYGDQLLDHKQVVRAQVTTAVALDDAQQKAIADALGKATGRDVRLDTAVDPALMGGVVARVGSVVYDGSVRRQLEKMKESLLTGSNS